MSLWETLTSDARHSLYEDTYAIEFCCKTRGARDFTTELSDEFVVRLDTDEKKEKLAKIKFSVTEITIDHAKRVVKARYKRGTVTNVGKWKEDVTKIIETEGIEVVSLPDFDQKDTWDIVHVGLKANEASTQIKKQLPGVCCHVIRDKLSLLLYSGDPQLLQRAVDMAKAARPSGGLSREFSTPRAGIKVCFVSADITDAPTEAVVSSTDKNLSFSGGVSKAIKRVVIPEMEEECRAFLRANKILEETQVIHTTGEPRWKYVIHAHGPEWPRLSSQERKDRCRDLLTDTVYNCIQSAAVLTIESVAIPFISSQAFGVPEEVCAKSILAAINRFDQNVDMKQLTLKKIIFMDIAQSKVSEILRIISKLVGHTLMAETTLRVVLVGKTGTGKSSTGNSILDKNAFDPKEGWGSGTVTSNLARHDEMGLDVVDTPGLFDFSSAGEGKEHEDNIMKEIMKAVVLCLPGPHAFLLVFNGKGRFTTQEKDVLEKLQNVFSEMIMQFVIIVFTHIPDDDTLKNHIDSAPPDVKALLNKFRERGRIVAIDNEGPECKKQAEDIIRMAIKVNQQNGGQGAYYDDALIHRCLQLINSKEFTNMSLKKIKEEVIRDEFALVTKLIKNTHDTPSHAIEAGCNIL